MLVRIDARGPRGVGDFARHCWDEEIAWTMGWLMLGDNANIETDPGYDYREATDKKEQLDLGGEPVRIRQSKRLRGLTQIIATPLSTPSRVRVMIPRPR